MPPPGGVAEWADRDGSLRDARAAVAQARRDEVGLYQRDDPLRLLAFKLRFLARRQPPDRWLVDLSSTTDVLLPPPAYPEIPRPEDRLFIPAEYVPLCAGVRRGGEAWTWEDAEVQLAVARSPRATPMLGWPVRCRRDRGPRHR